MARQVTGAGTGVHALVPIPEPYRVRLVLRQRAGEDPDAARAEIAARLTERCWRAWRSTLSAAGMNKTAFRAIVEADAIESWLWVMGDRQWSDLAEGLAGRAQRRLPDL